MPDEQVQPEEVVETSTPEGQETAETTEQPTETAADPNEQFLVKMNIDGAERVFDVRNEEDRSFITEHTQKGIGYTRKMQSISEMERANQELAEGMRLLTSDQDVLKVILAKSQKLNPALVVGEVVDPPEDLKQFNPDLYNQLKVQADQARWQKQAGEQLYQTWAIQNAQRNNHALLEKARIQYDLKDDEFSQVTDFMVNRLRPNATGFYSENDMQMAVNAVVGRDRMEKKQIDAANAVNKALKDKRSPTGATSKRTEIPNADQTRTKDWGDFLDRRTKRS